MDAMPVNVYAGADVLGTDGLAPAHVEAHFGLNV